MIDLENYLECEAVNDCFCTEDVDCRSCKAARALNKANEILYDAVMELRGSVE